MYHINSKGEAGVCRATKGNCPFGSQDEHYTNADDARQAFEAKMTGETLQVHKKLYRPRESDSAKGSSESTDIFPSTPTPEEIERTKNVKEFAEADNNYHRAMNLMHEQNALHRLTKKDIDDYAAKRDEYAVKIGSFTTTEQDEAIKENVHRDRISTINKLSSLRASIESADVGKGTERDTLFKMESNLMHAIDPRMINKVPDGFPPKDVWEIKKSMANYELDLFKQSLKKLGRVTYASSRVKKENLQHFQQKINNAQARIDEANEKLQTV